MVKNINLIVKNGILFTIAPFLPKIINVFLLPIMTKYLTDVDFGIFGTINAYTQSIGAFSALGLTIVLMNSFYKYPTDYKLVWRQIYAFLKLWMIVFALIQSTLLFFFIPKEAAVNKWWIILFSQFSTVFFGPTGIIGNTYYIYNKQSVPIVWRSLVASILTVLVDFILIVFLRFGYMGWYIGSFVGTFFTNASYWFIINKKLEIYPDYHFNWKTIKSALSVSLPTIPHAYSSYLLEGSGRLVLDQYNVSQAKIGQVSIAQQIGDIYGTAMAGLNNAFSPYAMQAVKEGDSNKNKKLLLLFTSLIFLSAFAISVWSKEIFDILLSNESLKKSYHLFIMYIMALCYRPMYLIISNYYLYFEKTKKLLLISFLSGCIAIFLYVCFTPKFGIWAFLIGHYISCLYFGYSGYFFGPFKGVVISPKKAIVILLIQLILTSLAYYLVELIIAKSIISIVAVFLLAIVVYKNRNELKR